MEPISKEKYLKHLAKVVMWHDRGVELCSMCPGSKDYRDDRGVVYEEFCVTCLKAFRVKDRSEELFQESIFNNRCPCHILGKEETLRRARKLISGVDSN